MDSDKSISRIRPSDVQLSPYMSAEEIDRLVAIQAFDGLDTKLRSSSRFRSIIANHTRPLSFREGDVIVRQGDWGNSSYFIISGSVRVFLEHLPGEILGRRKSQRKSLFQSLSQLWHNRRVDEFRDLRSYAQSYSDQLGTRGEGRETRVFLQDMPAVLDGYRSVELTDGEIFGEQSALGRTHHTATFIASGDVELLEIRWQGLRDLMRRDTAFQTMIDAKFRERSLMSFLQASQMFEHLPKNEEAEVAAGASLSKYGEYDRVGSFAGLARMGVVGGLEDEAVVAAEGNYPNAVILIRNGIARVSRKHHNGHLTVSYLGPGKAFGVDEITEGYRTQRPVPLRHSLRAIGFLTTIEIPTPLFEKHVLDRHSPRTQSVKPPLDGVPRVDVSEIPQGFLEFLAERQFVNGTESMLINLDRCTRCDDCVRACASTHDDNPRFVRQGPVSNNVMVANACMHCRDPVCMIECPTGAISRRMEDGVVVINDLVCSGCASCANNCPYDAIRMVEIRNSDGSFVRGKDNRSTIPKATICDLCVDQIGGPACQRACPHDALVRLDMQDVEKLSAWHGR